MDNLNLEWLEDLLYLGDDPERWKLLREAPLHDQHYYLTFKGREVLNAPRDILIAVIGYKPFPINLTLYLPADLKRLHKTMWEL